MGFEGQQNNGGVGMMGFGGYGQPMMQYAGMPPQAMTKHNNFLSNEEIARLQNKTNEFSLALTGDQILRAKCNHRSPDGMSDMLVQDPVDGTVSCKICGYKFNPISISIDKNTIFDYINGINDILQSIKLVFRDMPAESAEYFTIIPLLEKIPELFDLAAKNMQKYESMNNPYYMNNNSIGAVQALTNLGNIFGAGGFFNQPMQQNFANQGMPMGQPMGAPNPVFNNPFGFAGASQVGYSPATAGFQYVPGQQPVEQSAADTTTVEQKVQA